MFAYVTSRARGGAASTALVLIAVACGGAEDKPYNEAAPFNSLSSAGTAGTGTSGGSGGNLGGTDGNGGSGLIAAGGSGGDAVNTGGTAGVTAGSGNVAGTTARAGASGNATGGDAGSVGLGGAGGDLAQGGEAGANGGESGAPPVVDCSSHGETAHGFDSHCYVFVADRVTWKEAHDACESRGAYLVTISSKDRSTAQFLAENAFVWGLSQQAEVWIAATDGRGPHQKGNGTYFEWDNGEPMALDNWSSGQPNNSQTSCDADPCSCDDGACYEHCGFLWTTPGKQMDAVPGWNDRLCDHRIGFVCEWGD